MSSAELCHAFRRLALSSSRKCTHYHRAVLPSSTRSFSGAPARLDTTSQPDEPIRAAPEIDLDSFTPNAPEVSSASSSPQDGGKAGATSPSKLNLEHLRIVPASPSYFTATPTFIDDLLQLTTLLHRHNRLPVLTGADVPRSAWRSLENYRTMTRETVKMTKYLPLVALCKRLDTIMPEVMPEEVSAALRRFRRLVDPNVNRPNPTFVDEHGRARAVGRRKTSHAVVHLVEGTGEVLINGRTLVQAFGKINDREAAVWALRATQRLDKYNVFGVVRGGGTTGQAEALTLALAKALMVHEPALKPALRRAGVVNRDPRMVERKKPGHVKARKMPTWVKR